MKTNRKSNLKVVDTRSVGQERELEIKRRQREEESWKLDKPEIEARVHRIRDELQTAKEQMDAAVFDVMTNGIPRSLDSSIARREPDEMARYLLPSIVGHYDRCKKVLADWEADDIGCVQFDTAEVAFQIGILARAIFTGSSKEEVDTLERSLAFATAARG